MRLELQRLQAEHQRLRRAVKRGLARLETAVDGDGTVEQVRADIEVALNREVGDQPGDALLRMAGS